MKVLVLNPSRERNFINVEKQHPEHHYVYSFGNEVTQEMIDDCDVIIGNPGFHVDLHKENIKAILLFSAGSDAYCKEGVLHENTILCNASGTYGKAISEYAIGQLLAIHKNLMTYHDHQKESKWVDVGRGKEVYHSNVLIIGLGDIGYQIARRLKAFDCHITGVKRTMCDSLPYVDEIITTDKVKEYYPKADTIILALPNSKATYHLINEEAMSLMKDDAVIINVGRGNAIDEEALVKALQAGKFYGVGLDVTEVEPLPKDSPLWKEERVYITPHCSGGYVWKSNQAYFISLVDENLTLLAEGKELRNVVDFATGYRKKVTY